MSEATQDLTSSAEAAAEFSGDAARAADWAGEPFLHPGEEPALALAEGTARRRALDDALAELDAGKRTPSPR